MLERLEQALAAARGDALRFAVATALLAPFAIVASLAVLLFILLGSLDVASDLDLDAAAEAIVLGVLGWFALAAALRKPRHLEGYGWLLAPAAGLLGLALLVAAGPEGPVAATAFWLGAVVVLGLLGRAYSPRDDYYLGWAITPIGLVDDPFTLGDDLDRAHVALGFAVVLPTAVLESIALVFGSRALWHPLEPADLRFARSFLEPLLAGDGQAASKAVRAGPREPVARVLRALEAARILRPGRLALTARGRLLLSA